MKVRRLLDAALILFTAAALTAQTPKPSFEVASIKRNVSGRFWTQGVQPGGRYTATSSTLAEVMRFAYGVRDVQLFGGPAWVRTDRFDIAAKAEREVPESDIRLMLQSLLESRFRLVVRAEAREMAVHEASLTRADRRPGPNALQLLPGEDCRTAGATLAASPAFQKPPPDARFVRGQSCGPASTALADLAAVHLQTPIIDKTGLTGTWLFMPFFGPDQPMARGQIAPDPDLPSFSTAFQEQLGVRLRATRGGVDVLTIDSVQAPQEN